MKTRTGMPVAGAVLGAFAGLIIALILQTAGIIPAGRLVLFGAVGLAMAICSLLLTVVFKRVSVIIIQIIAIAMVAFGLTGIPALNDTGSLTGGCTLAATSTYPDAATPDTTSVLEPFTVDPEGTLEWSGTTPGVFTDWDSTLYLDIGGFAVPVRSVENPNDGGATEWGGLEDVGDQLATIESTTGFALTGVYHLSGSLAAQGECAMDGYVLIPADHLFDGLILIILWALLVIIVVVVIVLVIIVARRRKVIARDAGADAEADAVRAADDAQGAADDIEEAIGEQDMSR